MSNLLKRVYTVNKDERVIDYNDLIKKKLEAIMESKHAAVDADGFVNGLNADVVEELISDDSSEALIQDTELILTSLRLHWKMLMLKQQEL